MATRKPEASTSKSEASSDSSTLRRARSLTQPPIAKTSFRWRRLKTILTTLAVVSAWQWFPTRSQRRQNNNYLFTVTTLISVLASESHQRNSWQNLLQATRETTTTRAAALSHSVRRRRSRPPWENIIKSCAHHRHWTRWRSSRWRSRSSSRLSSCPKIIIQHYLSTTKTLCLLSSFQVSGQFSERFYSETLIWTF